MQVLSPPIAHRYRSVRHDLPHAQPAAIIDDPLRRRPDPLGCRRRSCHRVPLAGTGYRCDRCRSSRRPRAGTPMARGPGTRDDPAVQRNRNPTPRRRTGGVGMGSGEGLPARADPGRRPGARLAAPDTREGGRARPRHSRAGRGRSDRVGRRRAGRLRLPEQLLPVAAPGLRAGCAGRPPHPHHHHRHGRGRSGRWRHRRRYVVARPSVAVRPRHPAPSRGGTAALRAVHRWQYRTAGVQPVQRAQRVGGRHGRRGRGDLVPVRLVDAAQAPAVGPPGHDDLPDRIAQRPPRRRLAVHRSRRARTPPAASGSGLRLLQLGRRRGHPRARSVSVGAACRRLRPVAHRSR